MLLAPGSPKKQLTALNAKTCWCQTGMDRKDNFTPTQERHKPSLSFGMKCLFKWAVLDQNLSTAVFTRSIFILIRNTHYLCPCKHGYRQLKFPLTRLDEIQRMPHKIYSLSDKLRTRTESQIKSAEDKKEKRKKKKRCLSFPRHNSGDGVRCFWLSAKLAGGLPTKA